MADRSVVDAVDAHVPAMAGRPDAELRGLTGIHQDRLQAGVEPEALLPEAFAAVREAFRRTTGDGGRPAATRWTPTSAGPPNCSPSFST